MRSLAGRVCDIDVLAWFARDELRPCPLCRRHAALPGDDGRLVFCLDCGEPLNPSPAAVESA
jgi:hypothetical protein